MWPTSRPALTLERGEKASFALRVRPAAAESGTLKIASGNSGRVSYKVRNDESGAQWLDIEIEPSNEAGNNTLPLVLQSTAGDLTIHLTVNVLSENLTVMPKALDLGEVSLSDLRIGLSRRGRLGVRKAIGAFRIKRVSSTLAFLKLEQQTIVEGSNYLIKVSITADPLPKAGPHSGVLIVETDDERGPRFEIPIKLKVIQ